MTKFHQPLESVCRRPVMHVGSDDFRVVAAFLQGYSCALCELHPDLEDGFGGFRQWLAVRLDSCVKSEWVEIIVREHPGADLFKVLPLLYSEFARDRSEGRLAEILERFKGLGWRRDRTCWCELKGQDRDQWRPGYRRP
jgi:hypothetical protein